MDKKAKSKMADNAEM